MNEMSGDLSARTDGFPMAIQHDIPLQPSECGGPLLDLGGRCVGINVARAGRVKTFAVPAKDLKELLAGNPVDCPVYDFSTHLRKQNEVLRVEPRPIVLVEGILIFTNEALRDLVSWKGFRVEGRVSCHDSLTP